MSDQPEVPASTPIPQLPPEKFRVWDQVVENFMLKTAAGAGVGVLTSTILFRNSTAKALTLGFCVGTGFGMAFYENKGKVDAAGL